QNIWRSDTVASIKERRAPPDIKARKMQEQRLIMSQDTTTTYPPSPEFTRSAHIDAARYDKMYAASIKDPESFWAEHGKRLDWIKPYSRVMDASFDFGNVHVKWYEDGTLNVSANCIDRHLATRGDQTAI